jgi:hypothetical protein
MRRALLLAALLVAVSAAPASAQIAVFCYSPAPTVCSDHWHTNPVAIDWVVDSTWTPVPASCVDKTVSVDTKGALQGCTVTQGMSSRSADESIMLDMTPPLVTAATPSRAADTNGWYRSPLQVAFSGTDETSGLDGCTTTTYGGPDGGSARVSGTCRDKAGNVSAPSAFGLRYDATPPSLDTVHAGAGDHVVRLRWAIADAATVEVWRSPGRRGAEESLLDQAAAGRVEDKRVRNGRRYDYRLRAVDEAGNAATRVYTVIPGPRLLAPANRARVGSPPMLRWTKVRRANYYNVQLFHEGRKVLSAWPRRPRLQLERSWRFRGHKIRLEPGRYRWLVWPGRGPRSRNDYGPLIGRRTFTVAP